MAAVTDLDAAITEYWDAAAPAFDDEPDHGLRAAGTREAWERRLADWLPGTPSDVLDIGCGTGSLAALAAAAGHRVTGVDLAPRMVEAARAKFAAAGLAGEFRVGDAAAPPAGAFDVVLARHLVWTLPDPVAALAAWVSRLRTGGRLVLVEGRWGEADREPEPYVPGAERLPWQGGVRAAELGAVLHGLTAEHRVEDLSGDPALWGGPVPDERYVIVARV
jgi:SAM-dependent methyltransferase